MRRAIYSLHPPVVSVQCHVVLRNITIFYNYLYIRYYIKPFRAYATKPQQKYHKMCAHTFEVYASPVKIKL